MSAALGVESASLDASILSVAVLMFTIGAVLSYLLQRFQLPTFLAFILTGIILGPGAFNLIQPEQIRTISQVGIIFLLFIVGLDLSVDKLKQLRYQAPLAGLLQLAFTTVILTAVLYYWASMPLQLAFLLGSMLSLSSTAIVLKSLEDHREIDSDHGRLILGILIIQDLSIIPLMALVPALIQPAESAMLTDLGFVLLKSLLFGALAVAISLKLVPIFLDRLASINRKEVFTLALLCIGLGMALLTHSLGLSYEAGAFVAGLALSQSLFCRQVIAESKGFRDVFITLFFVSMGLLFDVAFLVRHLPLVLLSTLILVVLKALAAYAAVRVLRFPHRTALWAGVSLFQVGEFSFILLERTLDTVGTVAVWQSVLAQWRPVLIDAIILSMFMTPLVLQVVHRMTAPYRAFGRVRNHSPASARQETKEAKKPGHVIIAGYGPTGRNMAAALDTHAIPFTIVEMNLKTVRQLQANGIPCVYGDISRRDILEEAGVATADIFAVTFPDVRTSEGAVQLAKQLNPDLHCVVRSRYRVDVDRLYRLGVDNVVYEEFETSISFIFHIMKHLDFPILETDRLIAKVRDIENSVFHEPIAGEHPVFGRFSLLEDTKIEWIELVEGSPLVGKTLQESELRVQTGVNVIAVIRGDEGQRLQADPDLLLQAHDVLVAVGSLEQLHSLENLLYQAG